MTTVPKTPVTLLANVATTALSSTKAAPNVASSWLDTGSGASSAADGGTVGLSVVNGSSAPTTAGSILIQWSPDNGTTVYDVWGMAGDLVASSVNTAAIWIDPSMRYLRVIGYGNAGNNVTFGATFSGVTRA